MVKKSASNPCIRCGKERITIRVYKEKIGGSVIVATETACPDPKCQAQVVKQLKKEKLQRERLVNMSQRSYSRGRRYKKDA